MACTGKCTITEYKYGHPRVQFVRGLVGDLPEVPSTDPEAQAALEKVVKSQPPRSESGCVAGCRCRKNTVQNNVPEGQPKDADHVPWGSDLTSVEAPLKKGEANYTVYGLVDVESRILDGLCKPLLLV
jgi:hypothetical protein